MRLDAKFVTSAFAPEGYPRWDRVEVALAGRSNVGKSSMLNALAASKNLARTSRTPGRTRALNFFAVGDRSRDRRSAGLWLRQDGADRGGANRSDDE